MMLRTLAVVAACVGVNARPLPARPVGTQFFWGDSPGTTHPTPTPDPPTTVKTAAHKKAAAHKSAPTAHKAAPKHSLDDSHAHTPPTKHSLDDSHGHTPPTKHSLADSHGHTPPTKHTLADGHTHSSPELAQPAAGQAREAQLPARKLTKEERAAQKASEARDAIAVAAEAERAKAEAEKLGDQEAERKRMEKMQRAAEPSTATSTGDAKQRKAASTNREVRKQTALLAPQDWPYPDLPQDDPADNNAEAPAANDCVSVAPAATDFWCQSTCTGSYCPEDLCRCGDDQAAAQASEQAVAPANAERP